MKRFNIEMAVGLFLVLGFLCFAYISVKLGDVRLFNHTTYTVNARFSSVSGLKVGANVEIAGVRIGRVKAIRLDPDEYEAIVNMEIDNGVELQDDCIASIRTAGIIGDRYISISPGGSPDLIEPGGEIEETEPAINIEELISKYIFEKDSK
ncbi:phospholipid/cholesterol/gamma-HCH transport system substrate-binding protein [Geothermobacter ehrlichii]|uniref:Phospholipid/cholesterol/gamma-HCH transport system substrate-binding protein n=1 Tax=Geothermobacter ehrlichii TaxID=213224 RepID=A0A5D3WKJ5_9BACT|nr:outer membrane lipid asymmetry maintenance protein MlaD [Geothermobacter ehrlichii]TYO98721.1 phospholipid/cholesterol/gamma-HCH transport system substrate-binding protein [Geothermobacter ehrlichii]